MQQESLQLNTKRSYVPKSDKIGLEGDTLASFDVNTSFLTQINLWVVSKKNGVGMQVNLEMISSHFYKGFALEVLQWGLSSLKQNFKCGDLIRMRPKHSVSDIFRFKINDLFGVGGRNISRNHSKFSENTHKESNKNNLLTLQMLFAKMYAMMKLKKNLRQDDMGANAKLLTVSEGKDAKLYQKIFFHTIGAIILLTPNLDRNLPKIWYTRVLSGISQGFKESIYLLRVSFTDRLEAAKNWRSVKLKDIQELQGDENVTLKSNVIGSLELRENETYMDAWYYSSQFVNSNTSNCWRDWTESYEKLDSLSKIVKT